MPLIPTFRLLLEDGSGLLQENGDLLALDQAYLGYEVFDFWPNWEEEKPQDGVEHSSTVLDNVTGLPTVKSRSSLPRGRLTLDYRLVGRAELHAFRIFLKRVRGRAVPFWLPTWTADLQMTAAAVGATVDVEPAGYASRMWGNDHRDHVALITHSRVLYPRGVVNAVDNGSFERLTLSSSLPATLPAASTMVSFMLLVRLDEDAVELRYRTPTLMDATLTFVEVAREAPAA